MIVLAVVVSTVFAPLLTPYQPNAQDALHAFVGSSSAHPLGTDQFGRDILARLLYGARTALLTGVVSVALALAIGTLIGTVAGFYGGRVDALLMRCIDVMLAFPLIVLGILIVVVLGPGVVNLIIAVGISQIPLFTRLARAQTLTLKEREFVQSAIVIGATDRRIMREAILPNIAPPLFVQASTTIGLAILNAAALNFLGVGIRPPSPDWGRMVADYSAFIYVRPLLPLYPGLAIAVTVLALNLLGDGILKIADPSGQRDFL